MYKLIDGATEYNTVCGWQFLQSVALLEHTHSSWNDTHS